eukprot:CAMPEP_0174262782 /NCGR_PEP_ID=MMETSP0439-20130205/15409_1 /TAXON_ID=0 /ORGANISM="Stereomyxa ramosa, Strain Chinc5" /LENGTH=570 /DNA_ID=CAMNT_0015347737 /DNA_START=27 /DNA_END=1739 /DNA_ORIENTATION=+
MAYTAHTDPEQVKERFEKGKQLEKKLDELAALVKKAKHMVIFTGAGISTSCGIPDFRGPDGVWTLKAKGERRTKKTTDSLCAIPSLTHMGIVELQKRGICKYLISQNCDGLHRRSGIQPENISELHGNGNIEYCEYCGYQYLRDFHCYRLKRGRDHFTGRHCVHPNEKGSPCGGRLMNSTIDFGQNLPQEPMELGFMHSEKADLHIVFGSSLTVSPACNMPKRTSKKGKLVIVNLQNTPLDHLAYSHIYQKTDVVMKGLCERLGITIPKWRLKRRCEIGVSPADDGVKNKLYINGVEKGSSHTELCRFQRIPASIFSGVELCLPDGNKVELINEPFQYEFAPGELDGAVIRLHFNGHYLEPALDIEGVDFNTHHETLYRMSYSPELREWKTYKGDEEEDEEEAYSYGNSEKEEQEGGDMDVDPEERAEKIEKVLEKAEELKKKKRAELTAETDKGGYIHPNRNCSHSDSFVSTNLPITRAVQMLSDGCGVCGDSSENWLCLCCYKVFCGRYVNGHMIEHSKEEGHPVVASLSDLNSWCYECDDYVLDPKVHVNYQTLYLAKFGEMPPELS